MKLKVIAILVLLALAGSAVYLFALRGGKTTENIYTGFREPTGEPYVKGPTGPPPK